MSLNIFVLTCWTFKRMNTVSRSTILMNLVRIFGKHDFGNCYASIATSDDVWEICTVSNREFRVKKLLQRTKKKKQKKMK